MCYRIRRRNRLRIALVMLFGLLFQQVAMAAMVCAMPSIPAEPTAMAEHCADIGMQRTTPAPAAAVCAAHCSPDSLLAPDQVSPKVPTLALPSTEYVPELALPVAHVALVAEVPLRRSDPPPRLRYCSLLI